jgi:hypothetical protein
MSKDSESYDVIMQEDEQPIGDVAVPSGEFLMAPFGRAAPTLLRPKAITS